MTETILMDAASAAAEAREQRARPAGDARTFAEALAASGLPPHAGAEHRRLASENAQLSERLRRLGPALSEMARDLAVARRENAALRRENLRLREMLDESVELPLARPRIRS